MGRNQKTMDLISSTMTPSTNLTSSSLVKHTTDTTASSSSSMLPTATVNSQIQSSGVICNGTAISPQNITIPSSNNHVANSKMAEVSTNAVVQHVSTKPSPTKSLQVTMKDFDLL